MEVGQETKRLGQEAEIVGNWEDTNFVEVVHRLEVETQRPPERKNSFFKSKLHEYVKEAATLSALR